MLFDLISKVQLKCANRITITVYLNRYIQSGLSLHRKPLGQAPIILVDTPILDIGQALKGQVSLGTHA